MAVRGRRVAGRPSAIVLSSFLLLAALALALTPAPPPASAPAYRPAVYQEEEMTYSLSWWIFGAGEARLSLKTGVSYRERPAAHIGYLVKSGGFAGSFFRVNDRIDSYIDPATHCSIAVDKRLREGKHTQDIVVDFDYAKGIAVSLKYLLTPGSEERRGGERTEIPIPGCVYDVLSSLYAIRAREGLAPGLKFEVPTFDRGASYAMPVEVVKRESVSLRTGRFDALLIEPRPRFGGVFQKKGKLRIWIQDAPPRLPLRFRSEVAVGSFKADLQKVTRSQPVTTPH